MGLDELRYEIALANRILAHQGVLDAFGHVSARHPSDPNRYLLSRSRAPALVEASDVLEYTLDSKPVLKETPPLYSERVIHGEIYRARPDVMAVCHHHSPAFMPLVITGADFVPVFHLGAIGGEKPPYWDQRDEFGDTNLLVVKPEEGASLAKRLGKHWMVLMNRHGVTVAGDQCARMRVPLRVFFAQRRISGRRGAIRQGRSAVAGRSREMLRHRHRDHRPGARLGILGRAAGQCRRRCRRPASKSIAPAKAKRRGKSR